MSQIFIEMTTFCVLTTKYILVKLEKKSLNKPSYNGSGGSGRSTPEMGYSPGTGNNSRATTPNQLSNSEYEKLKKTTYPFTEVNSNTGWPRRSPSPLRSSYTDILCTASRKLRERSIPPPAPLPEKLEFVRGPPMSGRPPPAPARHSEQFCYTFNFLSLAQCSKTVMTPSKIEGKLGQ